MGLYLNPINFMIGNKMPVRQKSIASAMERLPQPAVFTKELPALPKPYFANSPRFSGVLHNDYSVELRGEVPITATTVSALQRAMLVRNLIKQEKQDPSTLKFYLDGSLTEGYPGTDTSALADTMLLTNRKTDVILKSSNEYHGMNTLLSATGKRFAYANARISIGPVENGGYVQRNDDSQIDRELDNEYIRDMEYLLMSRAGIKDRNTAYYQELMSSKIINSMQALYTGEKGLIDAIIVGQDQVITREDLEAHFKAKGIQEADKPAFVRDLINIYELPTRSLSAYSAESIPEPETESGIPDVKLYKDPKTVYDDEDDDDDFNFDSKKKDKKDKKDKSIHGESVSGDNLAVGAEDIQNSGRNSRKANVRKQKQKLKKEKEKKEDEGKLMFFEGTSRVQPKKVTPNFEVKADGVSPGTFTIYNIKGDRGILDDDVIFFNDAFGDASGNQVAKALLKLDAKKSLEEDPSHIKILLNSPGGSINAGNEIRNSIEQLDPKNKVDVIVTGMAASCGAYLLASATGNRFSTPNARVMIHDAWWGMYMQPNVHYNEKKDSLRDITKFFSAAIGRAAGRDASLVFDDMKVDVWLNPLEAMFYGKKGLLDAILVGNDKVITREDVNAHLVKVLGSQEKADQYIDERIKSIRKGNEAWKPEHHHENDPFDNPLQTIETVAKDYAKEIWKIERLKGSEPRDTEPAMHVIISDKKDNDDEDDKAQRNVVLSRPKPEMWWTLSGFVPSGSSSSSAKPLAKTLGI